MCDSSQTAQTQDPAGPPPPIRRAPLSVHSNRGARNPPCHHPAIQTLDHSEGLADQGAETGEIRRTRSLRGEAGVRGKIGTKSVGLFNYHKLLDEEGIHFNCEVKVFPLLVKRQSENWPEFEQRLVQWVDPGKAVSMIKEPELKKLVAMFAKRVAATASKTIP